MLSIYLAMLGTSEEKTRFEYLYNTYRDLLYNYAWEILRDKHLAEDAVSETYLVLVTHMKNVEGRSDKDACNYLIIIVKNKAKKMYNERKHERKYVDYQEDVPKPPLNVRDVEREVVMNDEKRRMFENIKRLNPMYGAPLIMKYYYDMSNNEIASSLGITAESVKMRLHRGKKMLKEMMECEEQHDGEPV